MTKAPLADHFIAQMRADLAALKLCPHGVDRSLCADHRDHDPRRNPATEEDEQ